MKFCVAVKATHVVVMEIKCPHSGKKEGKKLIAEYPKNTLSNIHFIVGSSTCVSNLLEISVSHPSYLGWLRI